MELFNLAKDPYEAKNMAATETQRVSEMLKQMQAALDEAGAQYCSA
ncbi:hypothetical protein [Rubritalea tangerina]